VGNFLEDFLFGTPDSQTGETRGGIPAVADWLWPFEDTWVSTAVDSTAGKILTAPPRANAWLVMRGLEGIEWAESNLLYRPASTMLQAGASSSKNINPLYRDGIQWQDFVDMWNASEYITPARAMVQRQLAQRAPMQPGPNALPEAANLYEAISNPYPSAGGVSPQDYEEAWDNSPMGTVVSSTYDLAFLLLAGGKGVNAAASTVKKAAGLNTKIDDLRKVTNLRDQIQRHKDYRDSGGASGRFTVPGKLIEDLVQDTDVARVRSNSLLTNYTRPSSFNADELASKIAKIDNEELITELILADRGDPLALGRLFVSAPDTVWSLTHMNDKLAREFSMGGQFLPSPQQAKVIEATFDSAIERDEFFTSVRDMFLAGKIDDPVSLLDEGGDLADVGKFTAVKGTGSDFVPIGTEGVAPIATAAGMAQRWLRRTIADARINRPNSFVEIPLGSKGTDPLTTLLFWAGNRQPLNMVSYNRLRPDEVVEEMIAYSRSSRVLRQKTWTVTRTDAATGAARTETIPAWQWRTDAIARLTAAKAQGDTVLDATVRELQEELISVPINRYGIPEAEALRVTKGLQDQVEGFTAQVAKDGYFMDGATRVILDPVTRRQLADSRMLMPLDDLDWALRQLSDTTYARRGRGTRRVMRGGAASLDLIFKWFRTNVLIRPGYVPKNSFAEPGISSLLADGSIIPRDGLANAMKRFDANNDRRILQFKNGMLNSLPGSPARADKAKAKQLFVSYQEASRRLDELEELVDDLDSAGVSPATRKAHLDLAREERKAAYRQVKDLEKELDLLDDAWAQVDEIPTYAELSNRVSNLRTALTEPDFIATATRRIDELRDVAASRQMTARDLASNLEEIKRLKARRAEIVKEGGSARAIDEQISSLEATTRAMSLKKTPTSGLTPVEQAELDQLSALIFARSKVDVGDIDGQALLDDISAKLDDIREQTFTLEPNALKEMQGLREQLAKLDAERADLAGRIASRQLARERYAKRDLSGETDYELNVGGITYKIPAPFSTTGNYGTALRADTAADLTAAQTMTGGKLNGSNAGMRWKQSSQGEVIQPFDPRYWDEMTYVINRHIVGDDFANLILSGKSDMEIMKWFQSPAGKQYMEQMDWTYDQLRGGPKGSVPAAPLGTARSTDARITLFEEGIIAENRRLLNQYFPDPAFRARLATSREWTPGEVQSALGSIEGLAPIYGTGLQFVGNRLARVNRAVKNGLDSLWRLGAARPESRFGRWPYMTREYERQMTREIRLAQERGQVVDGAALQAMRSTAVARTVKEMENTFYNVRRMTNPVFASRYLTAFAAAGWNSTYRYFRLAYRNPGRATVMATTWFNVLEGIGTDENGDEAKSWQDTKYITFAFPAEWNVPVQSDLQMSADAINLGTQEFGYLPTIQIPISMVLRKKPDLEKAIRERYPDVWDALFEYGTGTDPNFDVFGIPLDPLMGSYQKKAILAARNIPEIGGVTNPVFQEIPDEDFVRVASQDYDYRMYQWAKDGQQGPMPMIDESLENARDYYVDATLASWISPGAIKMSPEGQFYRDEWYKIRSSFPNNLPAAIAQARLMYGPEFFFFMQSTSRNRAGMPATQDAYEIWQSNQDTLADLREMAPDDPNMLASLLFLDEQTYSEADFSEVVYNWQETAYIPGDVEPVRSRATLQERQDEYKRSRSWAEWNASVARRDAMMLQYGFESLSPDNESAWLYNQWKQYETEFEADPENALWLADRTFDPSRTQRALQGIDYLLKNRKFMSTIGKSLTWQGIKDYRVELFNARQYYEAAETSEDRKSIAEQWDQHVRTEFLPSSGNFANYYERYLSGRDLSGTQLLDRPFDPNRGFPIPVEAGVTSSE